jgi:hypothetical protein
VSDDEPPRIRHHDTEPTTGLPYFKPVNGSNHDQQGVEDQVIQRADPDEVLDRLLWDAARQLEAVTAAADPDTARAALSVLMRL